MEDGNAVNSCVVVLLEDGYEMLKGLLNTLVQPMFCSLNLLSGGAYLSRGMVCSRLGLHYAGGIEKLVQLYFCV